MLRLRLFVGLAVGLLSVTLPPQDSLMPITKRASNSRVKS